MSGLILSPEDRAYFLTVMRRQTNSAVHRRVNVLLLLADGWSAIRIAAALYLDASTVAEHRVLYAQGGRTGIEIARTVASGAHAILVLDGAGWHKSNDLVIPDTISLLMLPPYAPELNPVENIWQYLRGNQLAHRLYDSYEAIVEACCQAWNFLIAAPATITSIAAREWANVSV